MEINPTLKEEKLIKKMSKSGLNKRDLNISKLALQRVKMCPMPFYVSSKCAMDNILMIENNLVFELNI